jgi:hypothetical protein
MLKKREYTERESTGEGKFSRGHSPRSEVQCPESGFPPPGGGGASSPQQHKPWQILPPLLTPFSFKFPSCLIHTWLIMIGTVQCTFAEPNTCHSSYSIYSTASYYPFSPIFQTVSTFIYPLHYLFLNGLLYNPLLFPNCLHYLSPTITFFLLSLICYPLSRPSLSLLFPPVPYMPSPTFPFLPQPCILLRFFIFSPVVSASFLFSQ